MRVIRLVAAVFAVLTMAISANADVWDELANGGGDAGAFPGGGFQTQTGSSDFDQITGDNSDGLDSYLITVTDEDSFYVEDIFGNDTQAFAWDLNGNPLFANDDNAGPNANGFSFGFGNAGSTHLGNVIGGVAPVSTGDQFILTVGAFGDVANGDGGTGDVFLDDGGDFSALRAPSGENFVSYTAGGAGQYDIRLTGAIFGSAIPEPTSLGLFAFGLGMVAIRRRK